MKKSQSDNYTPDLFSENKDEIINKDILPVNNGLITFGKYEGKPIETLATDIPYCQWLLAQSWFKERYTPIYHIVINNICVPRDTPEHNRLQIRFTDDNFCMALGKLCNWKLMNKKKCIWNINNALNNLRQANYSYYNDNYNEKIEGLNSQLRGMNEDVYLKNGVEYTAYSGKPLFTIKKVFEEGGWDVIIQTDDNNNDSTNCYQECSAYNYCYIKTDKIAVEIKPSLGDDYALTLREIKSRKIHPDYQCLVYENFTSVVASLEQIKTVFASDKIKIYSFDEIENTKNKLLNNPLLPD